MLPPPRHRIIASQSLMLAAFKAAAIFSPAPSPLNRCREKCQPDVGRATPERAQDIAQGSRLRAGDDGQMARKAGECFLAVDGKKTFIFELGLEAEKALEQVALAGATNGLDVELKLASRFVERNQNACFDFLTVFPAASQGVGRDCATSRSAPGRWHP